MTETTFGGAGSVPLGGRRLRLREPYVHCDLIGTVKSNGSEVWFPILTTQLHNTSSLSL